MASLDAISEFVTSERDHFVGRREAQVTGSFRELNRYIEFLVVFASRYRVESQAFVTFQRKQFDLLRADIARGATQSRPTTPQEADALARGRELSIPLEADIESFYQFAKIVLDKSVAALAQTFNVGLPTFTTLQRDWDLIAKRHGWTYKTNLPALLRELQKRISDVRDDLITHMANPRVIRPLNFTMSGKMAATMSVAYVFPNEREMEPDLRQTEDLETLVSLIDSLVQELLEFLRMNRPTWVLESRAKRPEGN